ncbi:MAG: transposase [Rhodanobacteraceae bacterium]
MLAIDELKIVSAYRYRDVIREILPKARIVVDRFHVERMANEVIELTRTDADAQSAPRLHPDQLPGSASTGP